MFQILIVEDDRNIRRELKILLENAMYEVKFVDNYHNICEYLLDGNVDLVLLDITLPEHNGIELCSQIREHFDVPIIFVTSKNSSVAELDCFVYGGDDFIEKPYQPAVLLARIRAMLKRVNKQKKDQNLLSYKGVTLSLLNGFVQYGNQKVELSKNEMQLLAYLFEHKEEIVTREQLMEYLWDNESFVDDNTLSVNMGRVRQKLQEIGVSNMIKTKRGLGYQLQEE